MRNGRLGSFLRRFVRRGVFVLALALVIGLVLQTAPPDDAALAVSGPDVSLEGIYSWLMSGLAASVGWASPRGPAHPHGPAELTGTAEGHSHTASAAATSAGRGSGRKPGKGKGELAAAQPWDRSVRTGPSGGAVHGFDEVTSVAVPAKSDATSTWYDNRDGTHSRIVSAGPVNYKAGKGWKKIDTSVRKAGGGRWQENANSLNVEFAPYADDPALTSIAVDAAHSVGERLLGATHAAGTGTASTVTYVGALADTDLRLSATNTGAKESLVLRTANAAASWDFALDLHGLSAAMTAQGEIVLRNTAGKDLLTVPAGYAWDSAPAPPGGATTHAVTYRLSGSTLHMSLDPAWLHDPTRVFPVTVDPTFNGRPYTTYVESNSPPADHSDDTLMKVGTADSGAHSDYSFLTFPSLGIHDSGTTLSAATLNLFDVWSSTCTASRFDVALVTEPFSVTDAMTYPGPPVTASIGNSTPAVPKSCANTSKNQTVGDNISVSLAVASLNSWATGAANYFGLRLATTTSTQKWFASAISEHTPTIELTYSGYLLPTVLSRSPANGASVGTLTPTLSAIGAVDSLTGTSEAKFRFQVANGGGTVVADSGVVAGAWTVPAGKLDWGQTYSWTVQAYDGTNYSVDPQYYQLSVQVPQPAVTSSLSQNPGHGFDASIGNYTTSVTDADVATAGPPLSIVRSYNSRDPRYTGAFGAAWANVVDSRLTERYGPNSAVEAVVVTYPDGSDVAYGRKADGSFAAPAGRAAKLIHLANGYELIDKSVTTYTFTQAITAGVYGLSSITDVAGRTEALTWASGHVTALTSGTSGRSLHLTWSTPSGASAAHVTSVATDPATAGQADANTWTYGYSGDQLTSVCAPGTTTACIKYGYDSKSASAQRNEVLDLGATSYWPLAEASGTTAASAVAANEGTDNATYTSVTLGQTAGAGPLATSAATSAAFNGTSSRVNLPNLHLASSNSHSISLWFKAASGTPAGVLWSRNDVPIANTRSGGNTMPTLYLGTDGKLLGEFWISSSTLAANPITTSASVADSKWHNVVLTDSQTAQTMFLDGKQVGSIGGWGTLGRGETAATESVYNYLGTGYLGPSVDGNGVWPDQPHTDANSSTEYGSYFKGSLSDAAFFEGKVLTLADETAIYNAGLHPQTLMTSATRASGKAYAAVTYDPVSAAVTHVTDENGGSWGLSAPVTTGSSQVYRGAVLGSAPTAYYRLNDSAGATQAYSDESYPPGAYANTTLGVSGPFQDSSAVTMNGTSSVISLPKSLLGTAASSQEVWYKTDGMTTGGVLLSTQGAAIGGTTGTSAPIMWMTSDGILRAQSPSVTPIGPFFSSPMGKCIDDASSGTTDGNTVQIYTCNGSAAQSWTMYPDGTVRVLGKCLDIVGGATTSGSLLDISTCTGAARQLWQAYAGGLRNPGTGFCVDDPKSSTTNKTQLQIYTCNGSGAQKWVQSLAYPTSTADGQWHHAVLTSDATTQSLYVDGRLVNSSKSSQTLQPSQLAYAYLGGGYTAMNATGLTVNSTAYYKGSFAEAAFYSTALSAADVAGHYAAARNSAGVTPMTTVTVTDPGGHSLVDQYDTLNNDRKLASTDGLGYQTSFGYDSGGFQHTVTDPDGHVTTTGHDADGNVVSTTTCQNRSADACSTSYATFAPNTMGLDAAKGATITSSGISGTTGLTSAALVDGNTTSVAGALGFETALQTSANVTQWVQADFGSTKTIDQIALYPRTDAAGGFPLTFTLAVSADGTAWKTVSTQTNLAVPAAGKQATFTFAPTAARYVKLNATALRLSPTASKYGIDLGELTALNDNPDPTAGIQLTTRDGRSASPTDNAYLTTYDHDALGNVTGVTTPPVDGYPNGRTTKVDYTDGTTVAAADGGFAPAGLPYKTTSPGGAINLVTYFKNGDVASTTDPDGLVTRLAYDNLGRVIGKTAVSDSYPSGLTTTYAYDGQDHLVTESQPPIADRITGKVHTAVTSTVYDADGDITSQTLADATGGDISRTTTTVFDAYDRVSSTTDPENNTTTFEYDQYGERTAEVDAQGTRTEYAFDPDGRLQTQVLANYTGDPANPQPATRLVELSRAYDPAGRLASLTDAQGTTTSYRYTDDGLPVTTTRTDYQGKNPYVERAATYDAAGHLVKEVTNNGATTTLIKVDAASRQTSTIVDPDGVGRTTTLTYTPDDAVATNVASDGAGNTVTTTASYDKSGHLTAKSIRTNSPGYTDDLTTSWTLDQRGLPTSQTDPDQHITSFVYDEAGRLVTVTAPAVDTETGGGAPRSVRPTTKQGYDTFGEPVESQDANGNVTKTSYDRDGHTVSKTTPNYFQPGSFVPITATVTRKYDSVGNLVDSYDPDLRETSYLYDQLGDQTQTTTPDGGVTHTTYDKAGHALSVTDPTGAEKDATYDHLGRMVTSTVIERHPSPVALTTTYSYAASATNPGGAWLASVTSPAGATTSTGYDNLGEPVAKTDTAGNTTTYGFDLLGRERSQTNPDGTSSTVAFDQGSNPVLLRSLDADGTVLTARSAAYDGNGNKLSATDARGHTTTFTYDTANDLTREVQPVADDHAITTSFGYDPAGHRTRFTDGRGNSWTYTYNGWGLPESTVEPPTATYTSDADRTTTTTYDERGLAVSQTLPGGVMVSNTYDAVGNLTTTSGKGAEADTATRTFGYDKDQRVTSASTAGAVSSSETFGYDDRGDLTSTAGDGGVSSFAYNGDGQMTARTDAAGTASYAYDGTGRLTTVDDASTGARLVVSYNKMSQVSSITYGAADVRSFGYDALHRITTDRLTTSAGDAVASIAYGYDANNNVTSKTTTGFAGSAANTYAYDQADRLTTWYNGPATTQYDYDDSGNRVRVGSDVFTYDARDELTSDGKTSYTYSARGTRSQSGDVVANFDAYGQMTASGTQRYTYDALGRTLTSGSSSFTYSGVGNDVAADGTSTYSRDPGGSLLGIASGSDKRLAYVDRHTDVVGTFGASSAVLAGSTAYDPLGKVLASDATIGNLGYQSGWTDPASGNVNMAARWYNPANGQFLSKDTAAQNPVPKSAAANPFAFVDDDPMTGTDPSGHGWLSDAWHATTHVVSTAWHATTHAVSTAWNWTTSKVSEAWHATTSFVSNTWNALVRKSEEALHRIEDEFRAEEKAFNGWLKQQQARFAAINAEIKAKAEAYKNQLKALDAQVDKLAQKGLKYVKNHAASIATFVVSTAAFMGCEAVLGAVTGGVGAVAGAGVCGAVSGAIGGLVDQGFKCAKDHSQCGASSFLGAGLVGGVIGGLSGLGGAIGGKFLKAVGGRALEAVGGLFGRSAEATAEGAGESAASAGAESAADSAASSAEDSSASRAADRPGEEPSEASEPEKASEESSCGGAARPHSFTGTTKVLLADGTTKAIDKVRVGDKVKDAEPGKLHAETQMVERVIVTTTDHDFVDLKVSAKRPSKLTRSAVALAASVAALTGTLTTTFHHPFYDRTQAAFVEAKDLQQGDELQTPTGVATVAAKRTYHTTAVTYDLTIAGLHTYYVLASNTPLLVHNNNGACPITDPGRQVESGSTDLSRATRDQRVIDKNKGNLYAAAKVQGRIFVAHSNEDAHAEQWLLADIRDANFDLEDIDEIYSEYGMCPGCQGVQRGKGSIEAILPQLRPDADVTYSIPFANPASRSAARGALKDLINSIFE
ncbi:MULTISPECIES: ricin-type beta-trefoil lectin domain protein [unclassified Actinoplanes]|uniref:ricin-type beta-trefoil lectin domain protein n=1 Tax=unclassified Actinoplanes TaxID=2626549 RepID=UPI0002D7D265|nr:MULTISPECIES: ricin-type beta-trefoil lectin domain protein [unclassified Actinoplanes]